MLEVSGKPLGVSTNMTPPLNVVISAYWDQLLNVLSAKRSLCLNGYYLWWGLTPQCFKYKRSCWLLVVVGLTSQCLKCKSIAMPKC